MSEKRHQSQIRPETTSLLLPLAIGIVLILLNAYWIALVSGIHHSLNPAYASLFIAPIVNLFFLVLLNTLLKRFRSQLALNRAQLLIVYQMLVMLCLVSGHNPMDFILGILSRTRSGLLLLKTNTLHFSIGIFRLGSQSKIKVRSPVSLKVIRRYTQQNIC